MNKQMRKCACWSLHQVSPFRVVDFLNIFCFALFYVRNPINTICCFPGKLGKAWLVHRETDYVTSALPIILVSLMLVCTALRSYSPHWLLSFPSCITDPLIFPHYSQNTCWLLKSRGINAMLKTLPSEEKFVYHLLNCFLLNTGEHDWTVIKIYKDFFGTIMIYHM